MKLKSIIWKSVNSELCNDLIYHVSYINNEKFFMIYKNNNLYQIKNVYLKKHKRLDEQFDTLEQCKLYCEQLIKDIIFNYFE
jgi:hypothetical protein